MLPVAPAEAWISAAPSASRFHRWVQPASNSSVIGEGARIVLFVLVPKKPTTMSPAAVVVTEGAANDPLFGVKAPLCESIGEAGSTFVKSVMLPTCPTAEDADHV
jgi:hypothetical protein